MLSDFAGADEVYIVCGYTDSDGELMVWPAWFSSSSRLFLFCGRRRVWIKALYWEGDGFLLLYKRLAGGSFQWPRSEAEAKLLMPQQYRWLMEGLNVEQPKAHRSVRRCQ